MKIKGGGQKKGKQKRKGVIDICINAIATGVIGCDCKPVGNGYVNRGEAAATVKRIKFHQSLDQQRWNV